jgi:hypothetical protein
VGGVQKQGLLAFCKPLPKLVASPNEVEKKRGLHKNAGQLAQPMPEFRATHSRDVGGTGYLMGDDIIGNRGTSAPNVSVDVGPRRAHFNGFSVAQDDGTQPNIVLLYINLLHKLILTEVPGFWRYSVGWGLFFSLNGSEGRTVRHHSAGGDTGEIDLDNHMRHRIRVYYSIPISLLTICGST